MTWTNFCIGQHGLAAGTWVEAYGKRNGVPGELLVRVTPTKFHFVQNVAGW
ncbi:MAG TPA: hypothetical protein VFA41_15770 [Ktedonobacteraceae bacterium]|nr:hypothetical protein [Ktedonobacteraceae bacterium]